jgi:hypothetical protein
MSQGYYLIFLVRVPLGSTPVNRGHAAIAIIGCSFCLGGRPRRLGAILVRTQKFSEKGKAPPTLIET